jgi:hypothetical protein
MYVLSRVTFGVFLFPKSSTVFVSTIFRVAGSCPETLLVQAVSLQGKLEAGLAAMPS